MAGIPYAPTAKNAIKGALIYGTGDLIASLIADNASITRTLGMCIVGATLYAWEIPTYFDWIEKYSRKISGWKRVTQKTLLALAYFNPLWITRHIFFILLFSGAINEIGWSLFINGTTSFLQAVPITVVANGIIQTKIPLKHRFVASALFSCAMAIIYPLLALSGKL